jgi:hypothetical protein
MILGRGGGCVGASSATSLGGGAGSGLGGGDVSGLGGGAGSGRGGGIAAAVAGGGGAGVSAARSIGGGSGGVGGAGGGCGAGLASFSPLAIWLNSLNVIVSIAVDSGLSANLGAEARPRTIRTKSAPCSAMEPARPRYDRPPPKAASGYRLIGSVTSATFLNPAVVTADMISATRP